MDLVFSGRAYSKIILHAIKYPHCTTNGLLLGKKNNDNELQIIDAMPLFHICVQMTPMYEIALTMAEQLGLTQDLKIVGYYLANENINDNSVDKPVDRVILEKIVEYFSNAIIAVIDNKSMNINMWCNPLKISQYLNGNLILKHKSSINYEGGENILKATHDLIEEKEYRNLIDFDNHLDNISLDWQNLKLNKKIDEVLKNYQ